MRRARRQAVGWITANPHANALLLMLALRREAPDAYATIPAGARARVLAAALAERAVLNDFGWIGERGAGHDREAGQALLELGDAAIPALHAAARRHVSEAPLDGSEEATLAEELGLRRADFAYRYLARIAGREPGVRQRPRGQGRADRAPAHRVVTTCTPSAAATTPRPIAIHSGSR